jgi:long-chain acyl-CoA synthetase
MADTIAKLVREFHQNSPDLTVQWVKDAEGGFRPVSWRMLYPKVQAFAAGLAALGVERGDHIGIVSDNMPEWLVADLAIQCIGAADVPRGSDSMAMEIEYILDHSECAISLVENQAQLEKVLSVKKSLKKLKTLIVMDPSFPRDSPRRNVVSVLGFEEVMDKGRQLLERQPDLVEKQIEIGKPEELATIIYTSGTTGEPKGVMLSNRNYLHQIRAPHTPLEIRPDDIFLSVLPVWHSYERAIEYVAIFGGCSVAYSKLVSQVLIEDMAKVHPTIFPSVPRIWESIKRGILRNIDSEGGLKAALAHFFIAVGSAYAKMRTLFLGLAPRFRPRSRLADALASALPLLLLTPLNLLGQALVFRKIKHRLGGSFRFGVSGAGALPSHVDEFFAAAGVLLLEGYGLTESAPIVSVRDCRRPVPMTVGAPLPEVEVKVLDEQGRELPPGEKGVLYLRGPNVMMGYYKKPELTAQTVDREGWLNTGDLVMLTHDRGIRIVGRAKETVVLLGGENVEPSPIEDVIGESDYVEQAMVVGQDQKYLAALVVPNLELVTRYAQANGVSFESTSDLLANEGIVNLIMDEINERVSPKRGFKLFERVNRVKLLERPFERGKEITHTLKLKREVISELYKKEIAELFRERR